MNFYVILRRSQDCDKKRLVRYGHNVDSDMGNPSVGNQPVANPNMG